jgi:hypothetical protein
MITKKIRDRSNQKIKAQNRIIFNLKTNKDKKSIFVKRGKGYHKTESQ